MVTPSPTHIVKVQAKPRGDPSLYIVSDKQLTHVVEQTIPQKARDALKGDVRAFFAATFSHGTWNIFRRAPEQFW